MRERNIPWDEIKTPEDFSNIIRPGWVFKCVTMTHKTGRYEFHFHAHSKLFPWKGLRVGVVNLDTGVKVGVTPEQFTQLLNPYPAPDWMSVMAILRKDN